MVVKLSSWILLATSAVLFAVPLLFPYSLWWVSFIFPVPLFWVALHENIGFKEGAIWGVIAIGTHLIGVFIAIDGFTTNGSGLARTLPALGLLLYASLIHGTLFWITKHIRQKADIKNEYAIVALWAIMLWCDIFFLDRLCLLPFDRLEGYFGFHPMLSLATIPQSLFLLPIVGKNIFTLAMLIVPASITLCFAQSTTLNFILLTVALIPWSISLFTSIPQSPNPDWIDKVIVLPASFPFTGNSINQAEMAQTYFQQITHAYPNAQIILLPESSFHCDHLSTSPTLCNLWSQAHVGKPIHVILGAFRWDGVKFHNSVHWIYDGKIKEIFDKRHAMALIERVPTLINYPIIHEMFFKTFPEIKPSTQSRPRFEITDSIAFIPYICSELFFNEQPDDIYPDTPILSVTNDRWCINLNVADLMFLDAKIKAIQWQRDILYVSFKYAAFIDRYGNEIAINRTIHQ